MQIVNYAAIYIYIYTLVMPPAATMWYTIIKRDIYPSWRSAWKDFTELFNVLVPFHAFGAPLYRFCVPKKSLTGGATAPPASTPLFSRTTLTLTELLIDTCIFIMYKVHFSYDCGGIPGVLRILSETNAGSTSNMPTFCYVRLKWISKIVYKPRDRTLSLFKASCLRLASLNTEKAFAQFVKVTYCFFVSFYI